MKVTMLEVNRQASNIVNQVSESGESAIIYKHGRPIAEIRALTDNPGNKRDKALERLLHLQPTPVNEPVAEAISKGRHRGV